MSCHALYIDSDVWRHALYSEGSSGTDKSINTHRFQQFYILFDQPSCVLGGIKHTAQQASKQDLVKFLALTPMQPEHD